jgi:hypothetical protein
MSSGLIVDGIRPSTITSGPPATASLTAARIWMPRSRNNYPKRVYEAMREALRDAKRDWVRRAHKFAR